LGLVEDIADHCVILQAGKIAAAGNPAELLADQALLQRANLVHAHRHRHGGEITHSHPHTHPHRHD
jgi:cobalt/nickel transport system ATP-binding protein